MTDEHADEETGRWTCACCDRPITEERVQRILDVALELEAQGMTASNASVFARTLGHRGHVSGVMKWRRAQLRPGGAIAVAEEEEELSQAAILEEDLRELGYAYNTWHDALERIWAIERDGPLSEASFSRKSWLEYMLTENLSTQNRLEAELRVARTTEAVLAGQQRHDDAIPRGQALVEQVVQWLLSGAPLFAQLSHHFDEQQTPLIAFRSKDGDQAFPWLPGGMADAQQLFTALYGHDPRALDTYRLLQTTMTNGHVRAALESCARLQPFPSRAISNYLRPLTATEEGHTNGSHS